MLRVALDCLVSIVGRGSLKQPLTCMPALKALSVGQRGQGPRGRGCCGLARKGTSVPTAVAVSPPPP